MSRFLDRIAMASTCGSVKKLNGRYIVIPLYHRRPPEPFRAKFTSKSREMAFAMRLGLDMSWKPQRAKEDWNRNKIIKRLARR